MKTSHHNLLIPERSKPTTGSGRSRRCRPRGRCGHSQWGGRSMRRGRSGHPTTATAAHAHDATAAAAAVATDAPDAAATDTSM